MSTVEDLNSKVTAMEIVLIALLSEKRTDLAFWDRVERIRGFVCATLEQQLPASDLPMLERLQDFLDSWREATGPEGHLPADASDSGSR